MANDAIEESTKQLEREKEIELKIFGDTTEGKERIEEKYRKKTLKANKDMLVENLEATGLFSDAQIKAFKDMVNEINKTLGEIGGEDDDDKEKDKISRIKDLANSFNIDEIKIPVDSDELDALLKKLESVNIAKDIFGDVTDTFSDMFNIDTSSFDFIFDSLADKTNKLFSGDNIAEWANLSKELIGSVLDASMQRYEVELQEAQRVRDVTLNNDLATDEAKENARKTFEKEERRIKTAMAKKDRENTLIKIAMDTAAAVVSIWAQVQKFDGGIQAGIMTAAVVALGATQAAIVASQPLPKFEMGTDNAPQGLAITQERRPEPITDKHGNIKTMGTYGGDTLTMLEKGDKVYKSREDFFKDFNMDNINNAVFEMNMESTGNVLSEKSVDKSLLREMGGLRSDIDVMGRRIEKLATRPVNIKNVVEIKDDKSY